MNRLTKVRDQINQQDLDTPETTELEAITTKLKEAWTELCKTCNTAREECDALLHEQALDEAKKSDTKVSKETEKIRRTEEQKSTFNKLRTITKQQQHGALNRVEMPDGEGGWNTVFEAERVCQMLIE